MKISLLCSYTGGYNREECLRTVECYDPENDTWTFLPPMKAPRARFQMAVLMVCVLQHQLLYRWQSFLGIQCKYHPVPAESGDFHKQTFNGFKDIMYRLFYTFVILFFYFSK